MIYKCTVHSTAVPRLIRNKTLPINLTEMTEEIGYKFSYEYRICILKESRRIITNGCRNNLEYSTKTTNARADRTRGGERYKSEGEIGRTQDSYNGRITLHTRNTVRNR